MARKVYYSKPLKYFWHNLYGVQKKLTPKLTDDQIFSILRENLLTLPIAGGESQESRSLIISGLELWRKDSKGDLLHIFFLDKKLRDFLEDTSLADLDGIKKFLFENGRKTEILHTYLNEVKESVNYNFALHLPHEGDGYAFSFNVDNCGGIELYFSQGENGGRMSDKFYEDLNKKNDEQSLTILKMFRLAINTIAYMNCFPDCVDDGVPKDLFEKSTNTLGTNVSLNLSHKIRETDSSPTSKMPYFRKGHFRALKADYLVKKKGQIVFVTETMVKGKAKTVSLSSEIGKVTGGISRTGN